MDRLPEGALIVMLLLAMFAGGVIGFVLGLWQSVCCR